MPPTTQLRGSQILDGTITTDDIDDSVEKEFTKVRVTTDDSTPDFLSSKIVAGSNVTITVLGVSGSAQTLSIAASGGGGGGTVATAVNDTTGSFNISNIQDGQYLKRSGNNIIGSFIMMAAIGISNETEAVKFVGTANDTLTGIYAFSGTAVLA